MSVYGIRYTDRALEMKNALPPTQRASLESLEKKLSAQPFGHGATRNPNNTWTACFSGGMVDYIVSTRHIMINFINIVAL